MAQRSYRILTVFVIFAMLALPACAWIKRTAARSGAAVQRGTAKVERGADKAGDRIGQGVEKTAEKVERVGEKIDQGAKRVGEKLTK